jgi:phage repressor protein C with HTH and peptisase S24 domain
VADNLRRAVKRDGRSAKRIAEAAGMNEGAIYDIWRGRSKHPQMDTLKRLAEAMNIPLSSLIPSDSGTIRDGGNSTDPMPESKIGRPRDINQRYVRPSPESALQLAPDHENPVQQPAPDHENPVLVPAPQAGARDLPVLGEARGGDDGFFLSNGDVLAYAERPPALRNVRHAYALVMRGTSMEPRYFEGELLCIHPHRQVHRDNFVHIEMHDGRSYVKQFLRRDNDWVWLRQLNPEATVQFRTEDIRHIRRIIATAEDW